MYLDLRVALGEEFYLQNNTNIFHIHQHKKKSNSIEIQTIPSNGKITPTLQLINATKNITWKNCVEAFFSSHQYKSAVIKTSETFRHKSAVINTYDMAI